MQTLMTEWGPFALIHLDLFPDQTTHLEFTELVHRFLCELDPTDRYRSQVQGDYTRAWNEEGGIGQISFGDGLMHPHLKFKAFSVIHDQNVGGWTGVCFRNHMDMRSQTYPVLRLTWLFSVWLQHQNIAHTITLSSTTTGKIEVELPTPFDH